MYRPSTGRLAIGTLMANALEITAALDRIRDIAARGQIDEAEAACRDLLQLAPEEPEAWSLVRSANVGARPWADAEQVVLRQAIDLAPSNPHYMSTSLSRRPRPGTS